MLKDVPRDTTVFGIPAKAKEGGVGETAPLDHTKLFDVCGEEIKVLRAEVEELKKIVTGVVK